MTKHSTMSPVVAAVHIFVACGLAIAQPLFDLLGRNPTFFVAHRVGPSELAMFVLLYAVALPLLLVALELIVRSLVPRAYPTVHAVLIGALGALLAIPLLERVLAIPLLLSPVAGIFFAAVVTVLYSRLAGVRRFLSLLAPVPAVVVVLFVAVSPARSVAFPARAEQASTEGARNAAPVFFLLFDGLSLGHIMDGSGAVAAGRFPNLARLQSMSTWFRNASTVQTYTHRSVPAVLSGRYPLEDSPTSEHYPQNLFTMLAATHELHVAERVTQLCPPGMCIVPPPRVGEGFGSLVVDSGLAYLHVALPESWRGRLPPVDDQWGGFADREGELSATGECDSDPDGVTRDFEEWLEASWRHEAPTLHYLHLMLPHQPWRHLPSGQVYSGGTRVPGFDAPWKVWGSDTTLIERAFQQQLLQVAYADSLVGRLLDHLEREGLLERSLVVVTSDHGMVFAAHKHVRNLYSDVFDEVARIPLFVKAPGQTMPEVVDANVETIDILPTVADVLDAPLAQPVDGHSGLDPSIPPRPVKHASGGTPWQDYPPELDDRFPVGAKVDHIFGTGSDQNGLYGVGPHRELVGRPVKELTVVEQTSRQAESSAGMAFRDVDPLSGCLPTRLDIVISPGHSGAVAVALNGTIAGVAQTFAVTEAESEAIVMLRPDLLTSGRNDVAIFVVRADAVLEPVATDT